MSRRLLRRIVNGLSALVLTTSSLMLGFSGVVSAAGNNCTWTGAGDGTSFSDAANWSSCGSTVPQNGDSWTFDTTSLSASKTLNNNLTANLQVAGITFTGSSNYSYTINGNAITLSGNIDISSYKAVLNLGITLASNVTVNDNSVSGSGIGSSSANLDTGGYTLSFVSTAGKASCGSTLAGALSGSGGVSINMPGSGIGFQAAASNYTGAVNVTSGALSVLVPTALGSTSGVTTTGASTLGFSITGNTTYNFPMTLGGSGVNQYSGGLAVGYGSIIACSGGAGGTSTDTATFAGPVTLTSNLVYSGSFNANITGTFTANGHTVTTLAGATGQITTPSGTASAPAQTVTVSAGDNQPSTLVNIGNNQTYIIDGQRGDTTLNTGGTLKGDGQINSLTALGGTVAPGHSPGTLTVLTTLSMQAGSTYQAELKNASAGGYDQLVVGSASDTTGNDVQLNDSKLDVVLYTGYSIKAGDQFTIINNLSKTAVSGTFQGLPEGTTFNGPDGSVFKITYKGGDGNDVVLTAITAPTTPNTGFGFIEANPMVSLAGALMLAAGVVLTARRFSPATAKSRR